MSRPVRPGYLRIGVVASRLGTTDGVSLEADKWCRVLERLGHKCFYFAGASDQPAERSHVVPEAHFSQPEILDITSQSFSLRERPPSLSRRVREIAEHLKEELHAFNRRFDIELLLVENALAIPLNIPLGIAVTEFIAETGLPTIAHHHDLYWERQRFLVNCVWDYLDGCFPPRLPHVRHVVINSPAASQLSYRRGINALIIPNVMEFEVPPPASDGYTASLREDLGLQAGEFLLLQPTRIVKRKGIEHSIELARRLRVPARLVISHAGGDEGPAYEAYLREFAGLLDARAVFAGDVISDRRGVTADGRRIYSLWDVYPAADVVTYPSLLEGFGNAFLEAVYFRKPIVVNDYSIYDLDIKPKGFTAIEMHGFVSSDTVAAVERMLQSPQLAAEITQHNFELGKRFFSFSVLEDRLRDLIGSLAGREPGAGV